MQKTNRLVPIFYVRGLNEPYTEGHVQVVRSMIRSLLLQNIKSVIFNYRYDVNQPKNAENFDANKFEQNIPIVNREEILNGRRKSIIAYASLMETIATLKFLSIEKSMKDHHSRCVVNLTNCFRYPRVIAKRFFIPSMVLHFYMRNTTSTHMTTTLIDKSDMILTSSKTVAHQIETSYNVSKKKIDVIYPLVDTNLYKPINKKRARTMLNLSKKVKIILYMGSLKTTRFPEKTVLEILRNLKREVPEVSLLVFAQMSNENVRRKYEILSKAKTLGLSHNLTIHTMNLTDVEKSMIYGGADVFLFPPVEHATAIEPPLTVLEAMASGRPVIATNTLSLHEIIRNDENGLLIRSGDHDVLIDKLNDILTSPEGAFKYSGHARQTIVEKASLHVGGEKLHELYAKLLN